eukprot:8892378-Pyramimonas_sp.AAC.1
MAMRLRGQCGMPTVPTAEALKKGSLGSEIRGLEGSGTPSVHRPQACRRPRQLKGPPGFGAGRVP